MIRRPLSVLLLSALVLAANPVAAEPRDRAAAEALFREGRKAADQGDYAAACERFAESNRLDPAVGTVFNLADCNERIGKLATAWQQFREVAQKLSPGDDRVAIAKKRADALEGRIPKLTLRVEEGAPDDTVVLRDGVPLGSGSLGLALPIDPGPHQVTARADGYEDRVYELELAEKQSKELAVTPGAPLPDDEPVSKKPATGDPVEADMGVAGGSPTLGYVVMGVGAAGLVASLVTGGMVLSKKSTVEDECVDKRCTQAGLDAADSGNTLSTVSTVSFAVGVVGLGLGTYLVLSSDDSGRETALSASVRPGGAELGLGGTF